MMDLRAYRLSAADIQEARRHLYYQPFIVSDEVQTGIAYDWAHSKGIYQMQRSEVSPAEWEEFCHLNEQLRNLYDYWIGEIDRYSGGIAGRSVVDTACAEGYFLYRSKQRGAASCTGYDLAPHLAGTTAFLNRVTGLGIEFRNIPYDMRAHRIAGASPSDIVISSAILVHLSDPTYYLEHVASLARRALFVFSTFEDTDAYRITFEQPRQYHDQNARFPLCFSGRNLVSTGLLKFAISDLGFRDLIEIPTPKGIDLPLDWSMHRAFIALR
jgi:2-polyprenyl-3-methyl-5-hydroxy-6-metoxy-1,4-benzoquinol methylase